LANNKITEIALQEFLKYGVRDITITKLIAPLHISTKTFYKHFESKEALLADCLDLLYEGHYEKFKTVINAPGNPVNKILAIFKIAFDADFGITSKFYHDVNAYYREVHNTAISKISEKTAGMMFPLFDQGRKSGLLIAGLNSEVCLMAINTLYAAITRGKEYQEIGLGADILFRNLVEVYMRGLCTNKGRKLLDTQLKDK